MPLTRYETLARERIFFSYSTNLRQCFKRPEIDSFIPASFNGIRNCSRMEKIKLFCIQCFFFFADDDVKTKDLDICLLERVKSLVGHLQFMIGQKHNLVRHLILPQVFAVGQNVWSVFCLVGLILILVRNCYLRPGTIVHNV